MTPSNALPARLSPGFWSWMWLIPTFLVFAIAPASAADAPKYLQDHFSDLAEKVSEQDDAAIEAKLADASTAAETQLVLVLINKFTDYPGLPTNAKDFAYTLAKEWKVGSSKGKGIVVLFSIGDRQFHVVKTKNIPVAVTERIASSMRGEVTIALRDGEFGKAMSAAADVIAKEAPRPEKAATSSQPAPTPVNTPTHRPTPVQYDTRTRSTGDTGFGIGALIIGGIIVLVIIIAIASAFSSRGSYSGGYYGGGYGYGPSPYYGGYGDGGGGFLTGMFLGGMMNNMFGGGGRSHYGGGYSSGSGWSSGDTGGTSSWGSWGGGDSGSSGSSSWDSGSSWSSGGGDSSSFSGGDFGGGSSGGGW